MKRYDAIVIGAGHNGLAAAAYLARGGLEVLVLERRDAIGGAAISEERHPGFTYSSCSYVCSLLRAEIMRDLDLPKHGLKIIPYGTTACLMRGGDRFAMYPDADQTRREIARHSARDADAFDEFMRDLYRQCRAIRPLLLKTPPDPTSFKPRDIKGLLEIGRAFGQLDEDALYQAMQFWTMSCGDFLDRYFESDVVKGALAGGSIIGTALGPYSPGSAYVLLHHVMGDLDGHVGAWGFAVGGMGAISKALAGAAREHGAEIRTGAEVSEILMQGDRAAGVVLADGEEVRARTVVSNLDVKRTFLKLAPRKHLPGAFVDQVERFKIRGSSGKLNIALDALPDVPALRHDPKLMRGGLNVGDSLEYLERAYDDWKNGTWSKKPYLDIFIPSTLDSSMAPPGKHYMSVFVQYAPPTLADGPWTAESRQAFGDTVLDTIESYMPGFRKLVLDAWVRTPADIEAEVGLTEGNIFQGELTLDQLLFNRPVPGYAQYRSPIRGFYMCGSSTHPGGGAMGAPGANAAREMLHDLKRRAA
ncbi:NAD(P)/FAD-dependent oxidoreductase [Marivibrio halodurans]|uniref:Pyridine nucleotide-disulfide oxidoreductase domain-containing protein 2 n=1 Tax=Marivibrio halodurans TaxID=2039722 RepID=A0A8J7V1D5_9PROT|nr:NAD(P)/FAD-dependent oxidoreductase [Marivibrio halodurans]